MFRLTVLLLGLLACCAGPEVTVFRPSAVYPPAGVARAAGAVVWVHGGVSPGQFAAAEFPDGQPAPAWLGRLAAAGWDVWRFNRTPGSDPLGAGEERLIAGIGELRAAGYRRVIVAGFSRGAFIGMAALARPDLVEAVALLSPAAHGTRAERKAVAMADYAARLAAARGPMRFALAQFNEDPFDLAPAERGRMARAAAAQAGMAFFHIDRPAQPVGHMGSFEPEFDALYGADLARFVLGR